MKFLVSLLHKKNYLKLFEFLANANRVHVSLDNHHCALGGGEALAQKPFSNCGKSGVRGNNLGQQLSVILEIVGMGTKGVKAEEFEGSGGMVVGESPESDPLPQLIGWQNLRRKL
ncbi:hypothetical protein ACFE04_010384 [Oxalis oulophora]